MSVVLIYPLDPHTIHHYRQKTMMQDWKWNTYFNKLCWKWISKTLLLFDVRLSWRSLWTWVYWAPGCETLQTSIWLVRGKVPIFRRNLLLPYSGYKYSLGAGTDPPTRLNSVAENSNTRWYHPEQWRLRNHILMPFMNTAIQGYVSG
jgi:hypothetical protein